MPVPPHGDSTISREWQDAKAGDAELNTVALSRSHALHEHLLVDRQPQRRRPERPMPNAGAQHDLLGELAVDRLLPPHALGHHEVLPLHLLVAPGPVLDARLEAGADPMSGS